MVYTKVLITPSMAREWLERNNGNRPIRNTKIVQYSQDMKAGRWMLTHQGIAFNGDGRLLDGQNRLHAIVRAGVPVEMMVCRGVPTNTFYSMDTGPNRNGSDVLVIHGLGVRVSRIIAAAVPFCIAYERGVIPTRCLPIQSGGRNRQILDFVDQHPDIKHSAEFIKMMPRQGAVLPEAVSCFLHYEIGQQYENGNEFMTRLLLGTDLQENSAIFVMRRILLKRRMVSTIMRTDTIISRVIKTYNLYNSDYSGRSPYKAIMSVNATDYVRIE